MSLQDEYLLKDQHLQKALQHAPDGDIAPNEITRKSVLDYAVKVAKLHRDSWLARIIKLCNAWQIPHWHASRFQTMGITSLVASFLVVVQFDTKTLKIRYKWLLRQVRWFKAKLSHELNLG